MMRTCAVMNNCAMLIIKPHIIESGMEGRIIDRILEEGFEISGMNMVQLDKATAEEFFEVYKGVLPEYAPMVEHATSGPVLALEIRQENVVPALRELVGPHDPQIAKQLRPNTLRYIYIYIYITIEHNLVLIRQLMLYMPQIYQKMECLRYIYIYSIKIL